MKKTLVSLLLCMGAVVSLNAQGYVPSDENLKAREEFRDNKFGIFIHWGIYSMMADG